MIKQGLLVCALAAVSLGAASCGSGVRTMPAQSEPAKGTFTDTIKNNPNIPDNAKKAMLGNGSH